MKEILILCLFNVALVLLPNSVTAQSETACGSIIEAEFTRGLENPQYYIDLAPGDVLSVSGETVGDYLGFGISVDAPTTGRVAETNYPFRQAVSAPQAPAAETSSLSERGTYTITLHPNGLGLYTLYVGCTLRNGTVINPGDTASATSHTTAVTASSFSGVGFPGLAPVDFSLVAKLPLPIGAVMSGAITPNGGEIIGYTLDGSAGNVMQLDFNRLSGNLNLGVVVLSANNEIVFQASFITSQSLTTQFVLPSDGQYTIGVFRVELLPPTAPEATAFTIQGTLNP